MQQDRPHNISIVSEKSRTAVTAPVTGAWGGFSSDHSAVIAHFFVEYRSIPSVISVEVGEGGQADPGQGTPTSRGDYTREVQATFMMTPESALAIGQWLIDRGQELLAIREG